MHQIDLVEEVGQGETLHDYLAINHCSLFFVLVTFLLSKNVDFNFKATCKVWYKKMQHRNNTNDKWERSVDLGKHTLFDVTASWQMCKCLNIKNNK